MEFVVFWLSEVLNIFISDLDDGIKYTLMKFADDTKLREEGGATLQEDLDRWEEQVNKNLMKFNKCKVLHLGKQDPGVHHRLGSAQKNLEVLVDKQLNVSEQCAAVAGKANEMLGCINKDINSKDTEIIIPQ
ncbi:rna-directed dna polymerase from mobile element jockey-like [Willisornis vidua]|uniref:Rna-directed dna polymerase from mobile element jockey-like n=1 Tax=Willisornis vidua TaxID=1566151 RepID=A0ABQ9D2H9_9PASS|nr:rna-directed dna polymerase from mobile element jockey-like [Willisornis vidua]